MGSTSPQLARDILDALVRSGTDFAVLHRYEDLIRGDVGSDVDVVVGTAPTRLLLGLREALGELGVGPVVAWRYDVGGTMSVFFSSMAASDGVQVDMLHDPRGLGRYGVRSARMLARADASGRWPRVDPVDESTYLMCKRLRKDQADELESALRRVRAMDPEQISSSLATVFSRSVARELRTLLAGGMPSTRSSRLARIQPSRVMRRLVRPVGHWVHVSEEDDAVILAGRLARFLPVVRQGAYPGSPALVWWMSTVAPVRWRPGAFISWGSSQPPGADVVMGATDDLAYVVSSMQERVWTRIQGPFHL